MGIPAGRVGSKSAWVAIALFLTLPFVLLYGLLVLWRSYRSEVEELFHHKAFSLSTVVGLVVLAALLYRLRQKQMRWYGAIEFSVGLFSAWLASSSYQATVTMQQIGDNDTAPRSIIRVQGG